ncbi:MAG: hypothetical protein JWR19_2631 [Pedosphaera sp.]|nr:hypothetical protein [Pedosphaera sp.]
MNVHNEQTAITEKAEVGTVQLSRSDMLNLHKRVLDRVRKMTPEEEFRSPLCIILGLGSNKTGCPCA